MLSIAGTVVDGGGAEENEGIGRPGDEGKEIGIGDGVDVVKAEVGRDAEGASQDGHDLGIIL